MPRCHSLLKQDPVVCQSRFGPGAADTPAVYQTIDTFSSARPLRKACPAQCPATRARKTSQETPRTSSGALMSRLTCYVPPVGFEPTLGTLLGGRPLPLGYGGFLRIPRTVQ